MQIKGFPSTRSCCSCVHAFDPTALKVMGAVLSALAVIAGYALAGHFFPTIAFANIPLSASSVTLACSSILAALVLGLLLCQPKKEISPPLENSPASEESKLSPQPIILSNPPALKPKATTLIGLPQEIWIEIFKSLDLVSMGRLSTTCHFLKELIDLPSLVEKYRLAFSACFVAHLDYQMTPSLSSFFPVGAAAVVSRAAELKVDSDCVVQEIAKKLEKEWPAFQSMLTLLKDFPSDAENLNSRRIPPLALPSDHGAQRLVIYWMVTSLIQKEACKPVIDVMLHHGSHLEDRQWISIIQQVARKNLDLALELAMLSTGPTKSKITCYVAKKIGKAKAIKLAEQLKCPHTNEHLPTYLTHSPLLYMHVGVNAKDTDVHQFNETLIQDMLRSMKDFHSFFSTKLFSSYVVTACAFVLSLHQRGQKEKAFTFLEKIKSHQHHKKYKPATSIVAITEQTIGLPGSLSPSSDTISSVKLFQQFIPYLLSLQHNQLAENCFKMAIEKIREQFKPLLSQTTELTDDNKSSLFSFGLNSDLVGWAKIASSLKHNSIQDELLGYVDSLITHPDQIDNIKKFAVIEEMVNFYFNKKNWRKAKETLFHYRPPFLFIDLMLNHIENEYNTNMKNWRTFFGSKMIEIALQEVSSDQALARKTIEMIPPQWKEAQMRGYLSLALRTYIPSPPA